MNEVLSQEQSGSNIEVLRTIPELAEGVEKIIRDHGHNAEMLSHTSRSGSITSHPERDYDWQKMVNPELFEMGFRIREDQLRLFMFCGESVFHDISKGSHGLGFEIGDQLRYDRRMRIFEKPLFGKLL